MRWVLIGLLACGVAWADEIDDEIAALDARTYREREKATAALRARGVAIAARLQAAWKASTSAEVRGRIEVLLAAVGRLPDPAREKALLPLVAKLKSAKVDVRMDGLNGLLAGGAYGVALLRGVLGTPKPKLEVTSEHLLLTPGQAFELRLVVRNVGTTGGWFTRFGTRIVQHGRSLAPGAVKGTRTGGMFSISSRRLLADSWEAQVRSWMRETQWLEPKQQVVWGGPRTGIAQVGGYKVGFHQRGVRGEPKWQTPHGVLQLMADRPWRREQSVTVLKKTAHSVGNLSVALTAPEGPWKGGQTVRLVATVTAKAASTVNMASVSSTPFWYVLTRKGRVLSNGALHMPEKEAVPHPAGTKATELRRVVLAAGDSKTVVLAFEVPAMPGDAALVVGWYPTSKYPFRHGALTDAVHAAPRKVTIER